MNKEEIRFPASNGEHEIFGRIWRPLGKPRGVVQLAHGMSEHSGRYNEFAEFLAAHGYTVCANDHAGHGRSHSGTMGYMGAAEGHRNMVEDMRELYLMMCGDSPYILLGHSMGSFLARSYCAKYGRDLDGAIYSGTGDPGGLAAASLPMCRLLLMLKGAKTPGSFFSRASRKLYNKTFMPVRTTADWLSRDSEQVDRFIADELCGFEFTYGGYLDLFSLIAEISTESWAQSIPKALPIYMFAGTEDPVGEYSAGVVRVRDRLLAAGCNNVTMKLYEGGRHEMLNETNRQEVYMDTLEWIENINGKN